jgi:hypothetical protein
MIIPSSGHGLRDEAFKILKTGSLGVRNWKAKAATSCSNISHFQRQGTIRKITIQHAAMMTMQEVLVRELRSTVAEDDIAIFSRAKQHQVVSVTEYRRGVEGFRRS